MSESNLETPASSDSELVARMARGDRGALAALYERHAPRLGALARQILGQSQEAEDLLQDVFLEAWRHAGDYAEARGTVWSWLSIRTRSRAIDRRRAAPARRTVELSDSHLERLEHEPQGESALVEKHRLRTAFACMTAEEQEVLRLGYFEGLSSSEIATQIGIPMGTVKSRTRNALSKLREWFADKGGPA